MMQRVSLHVLFWVTYLALKTYMGVFLINYSWFDLEMGLRIQKSLLPELVVLIPKMLLAYTVMYGILPRFRFQSRWWVARSVAGITLLSLVLYHILWKYILFGVLFREEAPESSFSGDLSRYIWRMLDMFAVVGVACTIHLMRRQVEASRRQEQLVREKLQSELNFLRSQTNPHFLFNTLNSIYALSRKQSPQTPDVVMQLSKLLRYMIYECSAPQVPLEQEWKIIEDYVNLEKLRFGSRIEVEMKMENLDGGETIAPLLLLPLVENAFKHGAGNNRYQTRISLDLNKKGETITFTVINTCAPAAENEVIPTGIGLQNTRRQLELLYPGFTFETKRENGIFRASLALQLPRHETALPDH